MFGSQALEVAIGLVLLFFVIATAASSFVELGARLFKVRGKDLERTVGRLLAGTGPTTLGELSTAQRSLLGNPRGTPRKKLTQSQLDVLAGLPATVGGLSPEQRSRLDKAAAPTQAQIDAMSSSERTAHEERMAAPLSEAELTRLRSDPVEDAVADALGMFQGTSIYKAAQAGSKRLPSYLSAKAFAEAVDEMLDRGDGVMVEYEKLPVGLRERLEALTRQPLADANAHLLAVKSGIEQWFDESMSRLEGAYQRKTGWLLFAFGLLLAGFANASAFHVADRLWHDPVTREAVANASSNLTATTTTVPAEGNEEEGPPPNLELQSVADTTDELAELKIPVGWDDETRAVWGTSGDHLPGMVATSAGWLVTALLVVLGAPFWFNLLTQLVSLRSGSTGKPPVAADDPGSSTVRSAQFGGDPGAGALGGYLALAGGALAVGDAPAAPTAAPGPGPRLAATFGLQSS